MSSPTRRKAEAARAAARRLLRTTDPERADTLERVAAALEAAAGDIEAANREDLDRAVREGLAKPLLDRLKLDRQKLATAVDGVRQVARLADPVGRTLRSTGLDDGLTLYQVTSPLGVVACIFESRPDVVVQISALAVRSANAVLLKGGREASATNEKLAEVIRRALAGSNVPEDAVQLLEGRSEVAELLGMDDLVDLVIPRGSSDLVRHIQANTRIPVLGHAEGVCHVYVDAAADAEKALRVVADAKLDYPAACNAVEAILVHRDRLDVVPKLVDVLAARGVEVRADARARDAAPGAKEAAAEDWGHEWGDLVVALRVVDSLDEAVDHIGRHGSGHTDAIVTEDKRAALAFVEGVDAAGVYVNASTRFADGYRYGLGAEVGISTSRIHARGPVGLEGLTSYRWILVGDGHTAGDYREKRFKHAPREDAFGDVAEAWRRAE